MNTVVHTALVATTLAFCATFAKADLAPTCLEDLSGERITLLVPTDPGGGFDTYARSFAPALEKYADVTARVVNMTAGGGRAARTTAQNAAADELIVLIENTTYLVTTPLEDASATQTGYLIDDFDTLGMFHVDEAVWLGGAGFDFARFADAPLIGAAGGIEEAMFAIIIAASALGIDVEIVSGYEGSSDMSAAIMRGEVDVSWISQSSGMRLARDDALDVALVLSDGPSPALPDTPYLAGEGSMSWQLSEDLDVATQGYRRQLASDVSSLLVSARGLHISRNVSEDRRACMGELVSLALADEGFVETARSQGREVGAVFAAEAQANAAKMSASLEALFPVVAEIMERHASR